MTISDVQSQFARLVGARSSSDIARILVEARVADSCATGWATWNGAAWTREAGAAFARENTRLGVPLAAEASAETALFDLASLTKPMLAVALARSFRDSSSEYAAAKFPFDRHLPLREALEEAQGTASAEVALETFLAHRAGLEANLPLYRRLRELEQGPDPEILPRLAFARRHRRPLLLREAAEARRADCGGEMPGYGFPALYSDLGYVLVGEAMARAAGVVDAGALIGERLVRPLGLEGSLGTIRELRSAGVDVDAHAAPTEVAAWRGGTVRAAVHDENAWMLTGHGGSGHAGMFGTVDAVLSFAISVVNELEPLSWTHSPRGGGSLRAGFDGRSDGASSAGQVLGPRAFGHLGFTGTSLWIDPESRRVVVLLTNRVHPTRDALTIRAARPLAHDALARLAARALGVGAGK